MARPLWPTPRWRGYRSALVSDHVKVGVWSAGLRIINLGGGGVETRPPCHQVAPLRLSSAGRMSPLLARALECPGP